MLYRRKLGSPAPCRPPAYWPSLQETLSRLLLGQGQMALMQPNAIKAANVWGAEDIQGAHSTFPQSESRLDLRLKIMGSNSYTIYANFQPTTQKPPGGK